MKISLNWIKKFTDIPAKYTPKVLGDLLTLRTCEVEGYEDESVKFSGMVVGKVVSMRAHPNADKLRLADTDIGEKVVQIVCGGVNLTEGMEVPVALPGAVVNWHGAGEVMELKETKIRGEHSFGMICAGEEIGLPPSPPEGITDLSVLWDAAGMPHSRPGTPLSQALALNDVIFEVDNKSLTHRPDLWGHYGMALEFSAFLGEKLRPIEPKVKFPKSGAKVKVELTKPDIAARFLSAIITGIKVEDSPEWLKQSLRAVGMRPVNNVVDITNYVMLELGHPMHAFDRRTVANDSFVIRFAKKGETIETLDHKKRSLSADDALVTNGEIPLALAGVMGGANSEISPSTSEIVLEVATWNTVMIRKTSKLHQLRSDAAQRFEKSLDPEIAGLAFERACELILEICEGSRLAGPATDVYPSKPKKISVTLDTSAAVKKIGAEISEKEIIKNLEALDFSVAKAKKGSLKITVPSWRATKDINIEDDIVEEIARMHGYEKIAPVLPSLPINLPRENRERTLKHRVRKILSLGLGFSETMLYSFYGKMEIRKALLPEDRHLTIENPLTADQTHMRVSLVPNILKSVSANLNLKKSFKLYEIGRTYIKTEKYFPLEEKFVCGMAVDAAAGENGAFNSALGSLKTLMSEIGAEIEIEECAILPPYAHPSKCASVKLKTTGGKTEEIGILYELHPQVLKNFDIAAQVAAFEINFTRLANSNLSEKTFHPLPKFPGIEIDVSVLADLRTPMRTIEQLIKKAGGSLISSVSLIDLFEGKNLGEGKKSFTFRILLQSPDRTLTDDEMKTVQEKIHKNLTSAGFQIR